MAIHTPGPWTRKFGANIYKGSGPFDTQQLLFSAMPTNGTKEELEEAFANARLVAAAPDLLEALTELLSASEWAMADNAGQCTIPMANARNKARAARSKAVGGG